MMRHFRSLNFTGYFKNCNYPVGRKVLLFLLVTVSLLFITNNSSAQIIAETFEESPWTSASLSYVDQISTAAGNTVAATSFGTLSVSTPTPTSTNQTITTYTTINAGSVTTTTNAYGVAGTSTWAYRWASTTNTAGNSQYVHSANTGVSLANGEGYLITPVVSGGISTVSFWVTTASNANGAVWIGLRTNTGGYPQYPTTNGSAVATGGVTALFSQNTYSVCTGSTIFQVNYTITGTQSSVPAELAIASTAAGPNIFIDDIVVTATASLITLGSNPSVCYSLSSQTANLTYTAVNAPTTYSITGWSGGSFSTVTNQALPSSPIPITVPAGTSVGTYTATLAVSNGSMSGSYPISVTVNGPPNISTVPSGVTSFYKFSGDVTDTTGHSNGLLPALPSLTTDRNSSANSAYSFPGYDSYISTATSYNNPTNFSISCWFKTTSTSIQMLISFNNTQTGIPSSWDREIYMQNGNVYFFAGSTTINSASTYNDGNWHMATATMSSTTGMVLYVDGSSVATNSATGVQNYTGYWRIGAGQSNGYWFNGSLDDIAIYTTTTLTSGNVTTLYGGTLPAGSTSYYSFSGTANDANGNSNGTLQGALTAKDDRYGNANSSYSFSGYQYIPTSTSYNNPTTFSISAWFKTTNSTGILVGFGNSQMNPSGSTDRSLALSNGRVLFGVWNGAADTISSTSTYNDGNWHFATATLSPTDGEMLYVDGLLVNSNTNATPQNYTGYWRIGGNTNWGLGYFTGRIDDVTIYNGTELTASQISTLYSGTSSNSVVCPNSTLSLAETTISGATYLWSGSGTFSASTSTQNPTVTSPTTSTYSITVTGSNGCASSGQTAVTTSTNYVWTGTTSTDWSVGSNWQCGSVPTTTSNVIIPSVTNKPILSVSVTINSITLNSGATLGLNGKTFTINGTPSGTGTYTGSSTSSMSFGGSASGTIYFTSTSSATQTLQNLTLADGSNITLGNALNIASTGLLTVGSSSGATLASGGNLTLVSDNSGSARVAAVPTSGGVSQSTISGNVNVQCYIHSSNSSVSGARRAWRLLTAPITNKNASPTGTIYSSWQNGGVYAAGIGTMITAPVSVVNSGGGQSSNGLDYGINLNYSAYTWNLGGQSLSNLTNTKVNISGTNGSADNIGYFIFVRGDRTPSTVGRPVTAYLDNTTLSASGILQLGNQTFNNTNSQISTTAGNFSLVGNPYACSVSFSALNTGGGLSNLYNRYYIWNSNIPGSFQVGGYITMDGTGGGGTYVNSNTGTNTSTDINLQIQSGQAFFVQTQSGGAASITFQESYKTTGTANNNYIYRPDQTSSQQGSPSGELFYTGLCSLNSDSTTSLIDGTVAQYGNYCNCVDGIDAPKFQNDDEMISLTRNGKSISIERRQPIAGSDTLFLTLNQMSLENYQFKLAPTLILSNHPGLGAHLEDSYTGIHTPLNLADTNKVNFTINGNSGSQAANRFMVVFGAVNIAPVYTSIKATKEGNTVLVQWSLSNDQSMTGYVLQKSTDGINYTTVYSTTAQHTTGDYSWIDANPVAGTNYYRVLSTDVLNEQSYSPVVSAIFTSLDPSGIIVYPNPIEGNQIGLAMNNMAPGTYTYHLFDVLGQTIQKGIFSYPGGNGTLSIDLQQPLSKGNYQLEIKYPDNTIIALSIIK
jgi:concanavalin A-like lectin/glucanase superfamily protein